MVNRKKILFVIPYLVEGGAERALSNITMHFPMDWDIDILVNDDKVIDYPFRGNIMALGITEKPKTSSVLFQFRVFLRRARKLRNLKKAKKYQACISFLDSANVANILSGKRYCHVILSVRISLKQSAKSPQYRYIVNPLVKLLYHFADKVVAVSEGVRKELYTDFGLDRDNIITIENGYNIADIQHQGREELTAQERAVFSNKKIAATTGRLSAQKGQWHLIRAFTEVVKRIPDAQLIVIGSGELEGYLKKLTRECGIEEHVLFTGHAANPYQYLNNSDIFVLPSMYEGFPNALAEAICMQLPCISTDFRTGARELLAPDMDVQGTSVDNITEASYGILTPLCSGRKYQGIQEPLEQAEEYLAEAMILLLADEEKRKIYRQKSKARSEALKIDTMVNKWVEVIESC